MREEDYDKIICHNIEETNRKDRSRELLSKICNYIKENDSKEMVAEKLSHALGITQEQFEEANISLTKSTSVVLKRNPKESWINQYNPNYSPVGMQIWTFSI